MSDSRLLVNNKELTLKDKVYGPVCPTCKKRTGRAKKKPSPTFRCPSCGITICFRRNKFTK